MSLTNEDKQWIEAKLESTTAALIAEIQQQERSRRLHELGEKLIAASEPAEIEQLENELYTLITGVPVTANTLSVETFPCRYSGIFPNEYASVQSH